MSALFAGLALLLLAGAAGMLSGRWHRLGGRLFVALAGAGAALALVPAVRVLLGAPSEGVSVDGAVSLGPWAFGIDPLSAAFLLVVLAVGAIVAAYAAGYLRGGESHAGAGTAHALVAILIVSMALAVTARAVLSFLAAWEVMSVCAFLLVMFEGERSEVRRAGLVYLAAMHASVLALAVLFVMLHAVSGGWTFEAFAAGAPRLLGWTAPVLVLGLIGFGLKAGAVPLHFWLPGAHAAAPTPVSALLSGLVIKMGIYGLLRLTMLIGHPPAWWGWVVLGAGLTSGVLGVLWALAQHDIKRLLAYHSVENIGIILMGIGVGSLGMSYDAPVVASIGFAGALLHTLNHALFKSLLLLGAGSVARATGTRDLEQLGGLARRMPITSISFIVGSAAIVGLPPLNGFVSEWMVFLSLFRAGLASSALRYAAFAAAGLALIGALALACFAKVDGVVLLGEPRSAGARGARETEAALLGPMVVLALACAGIGLFPVVVLGPVLRAGAFVAGSPTFVGAANMLRSTVWISAAATSLVAAVVLVWAVRRAVLRGASVRVEPTWGCGHDLPQSRTQYSASSFAAPLLKVFGSVSGVQVERGAAAFRTHATDPIFDGLLRPGWSMARAVAGVLRGMQRGRIQVYLMYVVMTVIVLLLYLAASQQ